MISRRGPTKRSRTGEGSTGKKKRLPKSQRIFNRRQRRLGKEVPALPKRQVKEDRGQEPQEAAWIKASPVESEVSDKAAERFLDLDLEHLPGALSLKSHLQSLANPQLYHEARRTGLLSRLRDGDAFSANCARDPTLRERIIQKIVKTRLQK